MHPIIFTIRGGALLNHLATELRWYFNLHISQESVSTVWALTVDTRKLSKSNRSKLGTPIGAIHKGRLQNFANICPPPPFVLYKPYYISQTPPPPTCGHPLWMTPSEVGKSNLT